MTVTINGTTGIAGVDGSAATPAVQGADTNTGIFFPAADTIAFAEGGTEAMRINSSGNVGIGTASPTGILHIASSAPTIFIQDTDGAATAATGYIDFIDSSASRIGYIGYASTLNSDLDINVTQNANIDFLTNNTRQMSLTSTGLLQFNSGYGSVATAYGCRAWVNFDGTTNTGGFCTIRGSGNVTSVADNGTGDYTVNFTTAMPDANYAVSNGSMSSGTTRGTVLTGNSLSQLTGSFRTELRQTDGAASGGTIAADITNVSLSFFR